MGKVVDSDKLKLAPIIHDAIREASELGRITFSSDSVTLRLGKEKIGIPFDDLAERVLQEIKKLKGLGILQEVVKGRAKVSRKFNINPRYLQIFVNPIPFGRKY